MTLSMERDALSSRRRWVVIILIFLVASMFWSLSRSTDALVVYCAHDAVYAEDLLQEFQRRTGIPVVMRFDTEATKTLGLVQLLLREGSTPRCDVFWNNEILGTMDLADAGLLEPYRGPGFDRIPARFKAADGSWTGFAGRLRVYIVHRERMPVSASAVETALAGDLHGMAIAKPVYGTTRTHYTVLWKEWGADGLKSWHQDAQRRGRHVVASNAMVKNLVAAGKFAFGVTDSDDFFLARDAGGPVELVPVRLESEKVLCIPNSVAIIKGTPRLEPARQLVDFLLSEEAEVRLANSRSRQIPLGTVDSARLPQAVREMFRWVKDAYDLTQLGGARRECLDWLTSEYLP